MNENTIIITLDEYRDLLSRAERIEALKRMYSADTIVTDKDIKAVLCIEEARE